MDDHAKQMGEALSRILSAIDDRKDKPKQTMHGPVTLGEFCKPLCRVGYAEDLGRGSPAAAVIPRGVVPGESFVGARQRNSDQHRQSSAVRIGRQQDVWWLAGHRGRGSRGSELIAVRIYPGATLAWHDQLIGR